MKAPIIFEFSYFVDFISCNKQDNLAPENAVNLHL